jgi:hypothetical protein
MQYQCSYSDIEKGICYFLTTNPNQKFTASEILNMMIAEKICPELNSKVYNSVYGLEFEDKCNNASKLFTKIKKMGSYYSFSTENPIDLEVVKAIVLSPSDYPTVSFDSTYAEGETVLHILCKNGLHQYVSTVAQSFNIDPHMRNEAGQTLFDVIPPTQDGHQTFKVLFNIFLTQEVVRTEAKLSAVKESNMALTKKNGELATINSEMLLTNRTLVIQNDTLVKSFAKTKGEISSLRKISLLKTILIVALVAYICYDKFQQYM